ncbi:MAG: signal peptidase I [Ilumatobacteraceae bacterium]
MTDTTTDEVEPADASPSAVRMLRDWIIVVVLALGAAMLVRVYVLQQFYISGPSMEMTLLENDRVLVNKMSYRLHDIHRGDIVVFDRVTINGQQVEHTDLIKRVIGVENDTVEIQKCKVLVNGTIIDEPYLDKDVLNLPTPEDVCRIADMKKVTVPENQIFVMGDNRAQSFDSRNFGSVPEKLVVGRAFAVVWPFGSIRGL